MAVVNGGKNLLYDVGGVAFTEVLLLCYAFKELTTVA